jgi:hypothetical protein
VLLLVEISWKWSMVLSEFLENAIQSLVVATSPTHNHCLPEENAVNSVISLCILQTPSSRRRNNKP